jgi:hypothetical protein
MQTQEIEPKLNKRERFKARLKPIDYFEEFEDLDFENLGEGDRFFLQDFGIFTTDFLLGRVLVTTLEILFQMFMMDAESTAK